jgi:hypothetical protein
MTPSAGVAQLVERGSCKADAAGSSPASGFSTLTVGADPLELDRVVIDQESGRRPHAPFAEPEICVVDVDGPPAERADDVVMVRQLCPLVPRPALSPVHPPHPAGLLEAGEDPVDGRIGRPREVLPDVVVQLLHAERPRVRPQEVGDELRGPSVAHTGIIAS